MVLSFEIRKNRQIKYIVQKKNKHNDKKLKIGRPHYSFRIFLVFPFLILKLNLKSR